MASFPCKWHHANCVEQKNTFFWRINIFRKYLQELVQAYILTIVITDLCSFGPGVRQPLWQTEAKLAIVFTDFFLSFFLLLIFTHFGGNSRICFPPYFGESWRNIFIFFQLGNIFLNKKNDFWPAFGHGAWTNP